MAAAGDFGDFCFLCKGKVTVSGKIRIFGKSSVNIHSLILRATKVDLSVYAKKENLVICNPKCYKRLMKYQRALRKLDEILDEIEGDFRRDGPIGVKRLAEEPGRAPEANKSLKTTDGKDTRTIVESCSSQLKPSPVTTISCIVNATPIVPRPKEVSNVNSASVIPRLKEASNVKLNSTPILLRPTEVNNTNISTPVFLRPTEVINVNSSPLILKPTEVSNINSTPVPILPSPNVQVNNVINSTPILARPTAVSNVDSTQILKTPTEVCVTVFTRPVAMLPTQPSVPAYQTGLTQHSATGGLNAAQILTRMLPKPGSDQKKQLFVTKTPPQGTKVLQSHASIPTGCLQTSASAFGGSNSGQILTIIPSKPMSNQQQKLPVIETPPKTTEVHITIKHPSKTVHRVLTNDFAVIGKALVAGGYDQIAGAVLKNVCLKAIVVEKVLKLLTLQVNELCSTKRPSLLRSNSKERTSSDFEKVCLEWKGRAPIFYSFLMTCAVVKREKAPEWLPGVAIAGSVLLKQRNSHMNAGCAKILKMLLKSRSLEKLAELSNKIQRIEIMMSILEAKLASIPGLEDVTVATPAPGQPSGAAAASSTAAQPPASDAPQATAAAEGPPAPPTEEPAPEPEKPTMTVSKDPRYAKYFQMVKVGVPPQAIAPKMVAEGLDPSLLENPNAPAPDGGPAPAVQDDSDDEMSSTSSFSDED